MRALESLMAAPLKPQGGDVPSAGAPGASPGLVESEAVSGGPVPGLDPAAALSWLLPSVLMDVGEDETAQSSTSSQLLDDGSIFEGLKDGLDSLLDSAFDDLGNVRELSPNPPFPSLVAALCCRAFASADWPRKNDKQEQNRVRARYVQILARCLQKSDWYLHIPR